MISIYANIGYGSYGKWRIMFTPKMKIEKWNFICVIAENDCDDRKG